MKGLRLPALLPSARATDALTDALTTTPRGCSASATGSGCTRDSRGGGPGPPRRFSAGVIWLAAASSVRCSACCRLGGRSLGVSIA
jgi:hypothetical protein